jgi:preprotein translocase subunit SecE
MNREQKRAMQRAGQLGADGAPVSTRERRPAQQVSKEDRTKPAQFIREVRSELKKVSWPTRAETIRYSIIVAIAIVVLGLFIFVVDLGFGQLTEFLFPTAKTTSASAAFATLFQ